MRDYDKEVEKIQRGEAGKLEATGTVLSLIGNIIMLFVGLVILVGIAIALLFG